MKAREYHSLLIKELINETTPEELSKIDKQMSNKQQTAVEWLEKEQDNLFISYQKGFMSGGRFIFLQHKLFKQAKEMEKEQMIEFTDDFWFYNVNRDGSIKITPEQYYEKTYGGKNESNFKR